MTEVRDVSMMALGVDVSRSEASGTPDHITNTYGRSNMLFQLLLPYPVGIQSDPQSFDKKSWATSGEAVPTTLLIQASSPEMSFLDSASLTSTSMPAMTSGHISNFRSCGFEPEAMSLMLQSRDSRQVAFDCHQSDRCVSNDSDFDFRCPTCDTLFSFMSGLLQHAESDACEEHLGRNTALGKFLHYLRLRLREL